MALGWRRQRRSPHSARTSPSSVAARPGRALRRLASGRRPGGQRRWRHSSLTSRRRPQCADWPPRCWPAIQSWKCSSTTPVRCTEDGTTELARRLDGTGVTANCFHPGLVATGFNRNNGLLMDFGMTILRPVSRSPEKGAETLVWLATSPDVANVSGVYFFDQEQRPPSPEAQDPKTAGRLWEISERQCAVCGRNSEARS